MADVAAAPAPVKAKKAAKPKKVASHPKYSDMVQEAICALKERGGSSRQAILKYIGKNYKVGDNDKTVAAHLKLALKSGVKKGTLKQSKGTGASGSFRVGTVVKAPKAKKATKPKAAKPKKAKTPKKAAKKPVAKKTAPKKAVAAKPKKAKTPAKKPKAAAAAAAKPKKAVKSPKKTKAAKPKKAKTPKKKAAAKK